jgi:hypothetical protein
VRFSRGVEAKHVLKNPENRKLKSEKEFNWRVELRLGVCRKSRRDDRALDGLMSRSTAIPVYSVFQQCCFERNPGAEFC